jgi:hypothetical protein
MEELGIRHRRLALPQIFLDALYDACITNRVAITGIPHKKKEGRWRRPSHSCVSLNLYNLPPATLWLLTPAVKARFLRIPTIFSLPWTARVIPLSQLGMPARPSKRTKENRRSEGSAAS